MAGLGSEVVRDTDRVAAGIGWLHWVLAFGQLARGLEVTHSLLCGRQGKPMSVSRVLLYPKHSQEGWDEKKNQGWGCSKGVSQLEKEVTRTREG